MSVELLWVQILAIIASSFLILSLTCFFVHADKSPCCLMIIWTTFYSVFLHLFRIVPTNDTTLSIVPVVLERHVRNIDCFDVIQIFAPFFWKRPRIDVQISFLWISLINSLAM